VSSRSPLPDLAPSGIHRTEAPEFDAVYAEYFAFVWRCLRGLGVSDAGLEDASQDVFVVVHRKLPEFQGSSSVRTWLYGIVRNVASNHRRTRTRKGDNQSLDEHIVSSAPGPLELAQDAEAAAFVQRFLAGLDERKRDVFLLALLEEMTIPEVASVLDVPLNTAYSRLRLVRAEWERALARKKVER
jgi:RNA polymerase sigma-70 factor (ECF subfamily)